MIPVRSLIPNYEVEILREARDIIAHEANSLKHVCQELDSQFVASSILLQNCTGNVIVTGVGKAGLIGRKISATFASVGLPSTFLHPTEAMHGDLGIISPGDLVIAFSNSGETDELVQVVPLLKAREFPIIAITSNHKSTLSRMATYTIAYGKHKEAGLQGLPPSTTTTIMAAVGDALALVAARLRGFTPDLFARFHPGGNLGKQLLQVCEIMRSEQNIRVSQEDVIVKHVFSQKLLPSRRTGAVIIVDETGKLTGIFTDSDLARLLENHREAELDAPIKDVMTKNPITVGPQTLLTEVLEILSCKKVSELPVVDERGFPIGMVDITDVISLLPVDAR